mmetsp:Transcript_1588/g.4128  ORF Transcript_1588/g.4128 Transcript_1588/m.4128 type:complete len:323 (+) Transcript_1588:1273-2241(+)
MGDNGSSCSLRGNRDSSARSDAKKLCSSPKYPATMKTVLNPKVFCFSRSRKLPSSLAAAMAQCRSSPPASKTCASSTRSILPPCCSRNAWHLVVVSSTVPPHKSCLCTLTISAHCVIPASAMTSASALATMDLPTPGGPSNTRFGYGSYNLPLSITLMSTAASALAASVPTRASRVTIAWSSVGELSNSRPWRFLIMLNVIRSSTGQSFRGRSHSLIVVSPELVTTRRPLHENAHAVTEFECPRRVSRHSPVKVSHSFTVSSPEPLTTQPRSGEKPHALTHAVWPLNVLRHLPLSASHSFIVVSPELLTTLRPSDENSHAVI